MRRLISATALALLALASSLVNSHAARRTCDCPTVTVSCLDSVSNGEGATFTVTIGSADANAKLTYNWVVSAGMIQSGQGTSSIDVDTTGVPNRELKATVEVVGFPESCPRSASCTTVMFGNIGYHDKIDEYVNIRFEDEKARLDNFAIELQSWPEGKGYIVAYGGRRARPGEALKRAERAKRYLTTVRNIPARQVVVIDGGYREHLTVELKLRPQDAPPPQPTPTVDPKEVLIIKVAKPKGRHHR